MPGNLWWPKIVSWKRLWSTLYSCACASLPQNVCNGSWVLHRCWTIISKPPLHFNNISSVLQSREQAHSEQDSKGSVLAATASNQLLFKCKSPFVMYSMQLHKRVKTNIRTVVNNCACRSWLWQVCVHVCKLFALICENQNLFLFYVSVEWFPLFVHIPVYQTSTVCT